MADVESQFEAAVNVVRSLPKKGSYQPSYETMLKFYGYFKQAKQGPCNESKPGFWDVVKKAKWDAWSSLGDMSSVEAMKCYVDEIKKVMQTMPDTEEMADFSHVLKSFYECVYEPTGEEPPYILHIFKKPITDNVKPVLEKCNGQSGETVIQEEKEKVSEQLESTDIHLNGFYSNGNHASNNEVDLPINNELEQKEIVVVKRMDENKDHLSSNSADNLIVVKVATQKKGMPFNDKELKTYYEKDENPTPELPQHNDKENGDLLSSSDESDEEFCDSIDPEHISVIKAEANTVNDIPINGAQNHSSLETTSSANENSSKDHRLTSTPFHKKPVHVTFNTDRKKSDKKDKNPASHHNGGILKTKQAGSGYGGGDHKHSSRKQLDSGYPQSRQHSSRGCDDVEMASAQMAASCPAGHSDSDSDDTNHNCESCDSSAEREEINERIVIALERIQLDMNRVLRRLETMEDVMAMRQEQLHSVNRFQRQDRVASWWSQFLPSKTIAFLVVWPFIINLIFYYIRKRKARKS